MRKREFTIISIVISLFIIPACAQEKAGAPIKQATAVDISSQEKLWLEMTDDAVTLYTQHRHKEAIALARQALDLAEKTFGPEHPNVAESLDNLATYLHTQGEDKEAEVLYQRALSIVEKNFGPESEYLAIFLNYLADFYNDIGRTEKATGLQKRAQEIRLKNR